MTVNFAAVWKSVRVAAKRGAFEDIPATHRVLKMSVEDNESKADKLKLSVANDSLFLLDSPLLQKGNLIRVAWGHSGFVSPEREFTIDKVTGGLVLQVEASGDEMTHNKVLINRTFLNATRSEVAITIARELGFTDAQIFVQKTTQRYETVVIASQTLSQFLMEMARRQGYDYYIDFDGFHFHERQIGQAPQLTLRYFVDDGTGRGSDILNFKFTKGVEASLPGKMTVRGRDLLSKEDIEVVVSNETVPRAGLGERLEIVSREDANAAGDPGLGRIGTEFVMPTTELTQTSTEEISRAVFKRVQMNAVELELTARGRPQLLAKSTILVEGLGPTLSGPYYVVSVVHNITPSPYLVKLKLKRDGKTQHTVPTIEKLPGQGDGVGSKSAVNNKLPPPVDTLTPTAVDGNVEFRVPERKIEV